MIKGIVISKAKARSILSSLSILADSSYHSPFCKQDAKKDFNYLDKKLYPSKEKL